MTPEPQEAGGAPEGARGTRVRALVLCVMVVAALLYGVVATAAKIPALFAG